MRRWRCFVAYPWILAFIVVVRSAKRPLHIAALLPTGENDEWVVKNSDAACQLAVDHINNDDTILKDYELRLRTNASNCNIGLANYQMYEQLDMDDKLVAIIAEGCSIVTQPLAETTKYFQLLQFNFLSSSPALDDRNRYPLYHQLLPSEYGLNPPRAAFVGKQNWTHAYILYEDAEVFRLVSQDLRRRLQDEIKVKVQIRLVSASSVVSNVREVLDEIQKSEIKIIFGLFYEETGRQIVCRANKMGMDSLTYVWIFVGWFQSKEWYLPSMNSASSKANCTRAEIKKTLNGHLTFDFTQLSTQINSTVPTGQTIKDVEEEFENMTGETFQKYAAYGYDTVVAIALMLDRALKSRPTLFDNYTYGDETVAKILNDTLTTNVSFNGLIGYVQFENRNITNSTVEEPGTVVIHYNYYSKDTTPTEDSNLTSQHVGTYNNSKLGFDVFENVDWIRGERPLAFPEDELKQSSSAIFIAIATIDVLGIILAIVLLAFTFYHREKRIIKLSSPRMNYLIGIGVIFMYISVILNGFNGQFFKFDANSLRCCSARNAFLVFGFSLAFGSMFAKTWRVSMIMKRSKAGQRNLKLTDHVLFAIVGVLLLIDVILLSLWLGIDPYEEHGDYFPATPGRRTRQFYLRCRSDNSDRWGFIILAYKAIILAFGAFLAFDTRKVKIVSLNDSRFIALSVYNTVVACILAFAFNFLSDPGLSYALTGAVVILMATVIVALVFLPKAYLLVFRKNDDLSGMGRMGSKSKGSLNEHTITRKSELKRLQEENRHHRLVIRMLIEEKNLSDETIEKVKQDFGMELEVFDDDETLATETRRDSQPTSKSERTNGGSDSGMGKEPSSTDALEEESAVDL